MNRFKALLFEKRIDVRKTKDNGYKRLKSIKYQTLHMFYNI